MKTKTPLCVHIVRNEGPTSEAIVGPFNDLNRLLLWLDKNVKDSWETPAIFPLDNPESFE